MTQCSRCGYQAAAPTPHCPGCGVAMAGAPQRPPVAKAALDSADRGCLAGCLVAVVCFFLTMAALQWPGTVSSYFELAEGLALLGMGCRFWFGRLAGDW